MSFSPFLGGKRICLGKTFAETVVKIVGPNLLYHFNFEYVDETLYTNKPPNNIEMIKEPEVIVRITKVMKEISE
jgi:cytochrome P450